MIDQQGLGESRERDAECEEKYAKELLDCDLVLWVVQADVRTHTPDEKFYGNLIKPHLAQGKSFIVALNKVDTMEPSDEWDADSCQPGLKQQENIRRKITVVSNLFKINESDVVAISIKKQYGIIALVETITRALPGERKVTFVNALKDENRSKSAKEEAKRGFFEATGKEVGKWIGGTEGKKLEKPSVKLLTVSSNHL